MAQQNRRQQPAREMPALIEAEQQLLGALMMKNDLLYTISSFLEPQHFFEPLHQEIYEICQDLISQGKIANNWSIKNRLAYTGQIGQFTVAEYLAELVGNVVRFAEVPAQGMAIVEAYNRRRLIVVGETLMDAGYTDANPQTLSEKSREAQSVIGDVCAALEGKSDMGGSELADAYLESITRNPANKGRRGVPIALSEIGTVLSEKVLEATNLYGLISSSGEGKSSMTLQIIYEALMRGHPVQFFSFDQSATQCLSQMVAQQLGYEVRHQKNGDLTDKQIDTAYGLVREISNLPFEIVDCESTRDTVSRMTSFAKRFVKRKGNGKTPLFVFDHMSAIPPEYEYRGSDEGTKALTKGNALKTLAKSMKAVCLVLQQRSGSGMKRYNPRPIPSDLYGGEGARQPFDAIFYLFRAEEHMRRQLDTADDEKSKTKILERFAGIFPREIGIEGTAEVGTLKVRFGKAGMKRYIRFVPEFTKYETMHRVMDEGQEGFDL